MYKNTNTHSFIHLFQELEESVMQSIATEMNLSETAYVYPLEGSKDDPWSCTRYHLRWFTPKQEIRLCGHATLATSHVLFNHMGM